MAEPDITVCGKPTPERLAVPGNRKGECEVCGLPILVKAGDTGELWCLPCGVGASIDLVELLDGHVAQKAAN